MAKTALHRTTNNPNKSNRLEYPNKDILAIINVTVLILDMTNSVSPNYSFGCGSKAFDMTTRGASNIGLYTTTPHPWCDDHSINISTCGV